jgi:DNA invertase Pin-like site-specific DNA recombinase
MTKKPSPTGVAAYARMSAKHQSIGEQMKVIRKFAKRRGLKIGKVYSDGGNQAEHSKPAKVQKTK